MVTAAQKWHETVGWRFSSMGTTYRCTRYVRSQGFWMRVLATDGWIGRVVGEETCVSERAIGRTFHLLCDTEPDDTEPVAHVQPCECYICRDEIPPPDEEA